MLRKRILALACLLVMVTCLLSAASFAQPVDVKFAYPWGSGDRLAIATDLVEDFNREHPNIRVEIIHPSGSLDEWLAINVVAGTAPDVFIHRPGYTLPYADQLVDMGAFLRRQGTYAEVFDDMVPGVIESYTAPGGKIIGLPMNTTLASINYFNKDRFAEGGVADPHEGWTWEDLEIIGRKLVRFNSAGVQTQWGATALTPRNFMLEVAVLGNGARWVSDDGRIFLPDVPETREAMQWAVELFRQNGGLFLVGPAEDRQLGLSTFIAGNVGIHIDGSYRLPALAEGDFDLRVAPPLFGPKRSVTRGANHAMVVFQSTPEREQAAATFVAWMAEPPQTARYNLVWGNFNARLSANLHPNFAPALEGLEREFLQYIPYFEPIVNAPYEQAQDIWHGYVNQVADGLMPVESAILSAKREIQPLFDEYYARR